MLKFLLDYLPLLATTFLTICYLPQIIHLHITKNAESMSMSFWILLNLALVCLWINALVIYLQFGTYGYLVTETLNEGLAFVVLLQVLKYKKKQ